MAELKNDKEIMQIAIDAFIKESGTALIKKYVHLNEALFMEDRWHRAGEYGQSRECRDEVFGGTLTDKILRAV